MIDYTRMLDLRKDRDMSQRQVAEALGLYTTTYARYERGEQEVPFCIAIALAKFYNVSLDYLAGLTNEPRKLN
jgi:transcriptional regulator with XRE-family HTH domain